MFFKTIAMNAYESVSVIDREIRLPIKKTKSKVIEEYCDKEGIPYRYATHGEFSVGFCKGTISYNPKRKKGELIGRNTYYSNGKYFFTKLNIILYIYAKYRIGIQNPSGLLNFGSGKTRLVRHRT